MVRKHELYASAKHYSDRDVKILCVPFGSANTDVSFALTGTLSRYISIHAKIYE